MHNYIYNPYGNDAELMPTTWESSNRISAKLTDYLRELQVSIISLTDYTKMNNPNYMILNRNYLIDNINQSYCTTEELIAHHVLALVQDTDSYIPVICVNYLNLHCGLINQYSNNLYILLTSETPVSTSIDSSTLTSLFGQALNTTNIDIYTKATVATKLYKIDEGMVVFSNTYGEDIKNSATATNKLNINNYNIIPANGRPSIYYPAELFTTNNTSGQSITYWTWYYDNNIDTNEPITYFNLHTNLRFNWNNSLLAQHWRINTFDPSTKQPAISTADNTLWTGWNNTVLFHQFTTNYAASDGIIEEMIVDEESSYGHTNLANYYNHYYTIDIKNTNESIPTEYINLIVC